MNVLLFISLLLAHLIGDFYFQNDFFCRQKEEKKIRSPFIYIHSLIVGVISWALVPYLSFWKFALFITVSHLIIDITKSYIKPSLASFTLDQAAHIIILAIISSIYFPLNQLPIEIINFSTVVSIPLLLIATLLCLKPTNILIKLILLKYKIGISGECSDIKNAGALIGDLERLLTIVFVLIGHYEAIGFIIAAKSILRFKDTDTAKTEYVLAGTFLSFGIAIVCGLIVK